MATSKLIADLEKQTNLDQANAQVHLKLANAYLQKIRETADTSYYKKAETSIGRAAKIDPENSEISATQAAIAYGRHDFAAGLIHAQAAAARNPNRAAYHGLVGDGYIELGNYPETVAAYQKMIDIRPDLGSYNRIAHIRELYGDVNGAKVALQAAIKAGSKFPENIAFSQVELGKLQMRSDPAEAAKTYRQALATVPSYEPALQGLGRVSVAQGKLDQALQFFGQAAQSLPIASYAVDLGDVYTLKNDPIKAAQQYQLAKLAYTSTTKDGVNTDQETGLLAANHSVGGDYGLAKAQAAYNAHPGIFAADTLAWTLYRSGNTSDALRYSTEALRLGEHDPLIVYHAGMIAEKAGNMAEARRLLTQALELSQHFSILDARTAQSTLEKLP